MTNTQNISKQLEEQAQKGIAAAQYQLALAYEAGDGVPKDEKKAFEWMKESASQGYGLALCQLGVYYMKGIFIEKSETLAIYYFNQAVQKGVSEANYHMGVCYEQGIGVVPSVEKALLFYERAVNEGVTEAIASYDRLKALAPETSVDDSDLSQEEGDSLDEDEEYFYKAEDYYYGQNGQDVDYEEAVKWYEKAAELNHADAQFSLGYCYSHGQGVEEDDEQAVRWYQKGAENGSADAQSALGECYYNGEGVSEDAEKAFYWFNKAAEQDNATACFYMGECYENGYGCSVDLNLARQYYQKAHELGDEYAEDALAELDKRKAEGNETQIIEVHSDDTDEVPSNELTDSLSSNLQDVEKVPVEHFSVDDSKAMIYDNKRSKVKDAIMWAMIYGGGFMIEATVSVIWGSLCAALKIPNGYQMWLVTRNKHKHVKDRAWNEYCHTNGNMLSAFSKLISEE